jgi:hypothetical protein
MTRRDESLRHLRRIIRDVYPGMPDRKLNDQSTMLGTRYRQVDNLVLEKLGISVLSHPLMTMGELAEAIGNYQSAEGLRLCR